MFERRDYMKKQLWICALALSLTATTVQAQTLANTWYGKVDAGVSIVGDTQLKELFGPVIGDNSVEFDPGARFGVTAGYNFCEWFAAEGEIGMMWNEVSKMGNATRMDAMFYNAPFMVNAKFQLPNPSRVRPYVGAGVGGAGATMDINHLTYGDTRISGTASDFVFAWQGFGGVLFELNENMSVGVEYRYVRSQGPDFDIDWGWFSNIETERMSFGDIETHAISLLFNYNF